MNAYETATFAGFNLPRTSNGPTIYSFTDKPLVERFKGWIKDGKTRGCIGKVTFPNRLRTSETASEFSGWGFYLPQDGSDAFGLRWSWCNEVPEEWDETETPATFNHTGWYADDNQDTLIRGIVCKLPSGRGFLAGWSMGEGMISSLDCAIYSDIRTAAYAADSEAESIAEANREYSEEE